jgi:crotonobetainyl-CoA:carnitine CoA-transferase CaiB-like acyl-CoA transferase
VIAVLAALQARHRTGEGRYLDVSTADGSLWLTSLMVDQEMAAERREGDLAILRGRFACYAAYVASDGKWLTVAAIEARFWKALCDAIGRPEWTAWHRDAARQDELRTGLAAIFATRDRDDWVRELAPKDCCVGPVHGYGDVWNDPHFRARNAVPAPRPGAQVGALFAGADRRDLPQGEGDPVERLFAEAGFSAAELRSLRQAGVVT